MQVTQKVIVKEIMTNSSKKRLKDSLTQKSERAQKEIEQLHHSVKKVYGIKSVNVLLGSVFEFPSRTGSPKNLKQGQPEI